MNDERSRCQTWIHRLQAAARRAGRPLSFMEVCGTHTVNVFRSGLHSLMPENVRLLSGPGCPVCVTSQGDIDQLIALASRQGLVLCTYGDMLRVSGERGSLELARSEGADVRTVYSAMTAVRIAIENPTREVVLAAVGFETTTPATAAAIVDAERRGLENFSVLTSHKRIVPAMRALLDSSRARLDGFLCPGHVAVIVGAEVFGCIVANYKLPCVIAGFEDLQIAAGLARLTEMAADGRCDLENLYPQAVSTRGNRVATMMIDHVFEPANVTWRALGELPDSGLTLRPAFARFDARRRFALAVHEPQEPKNCRCGEIITGRCTPPDCGLFARCCTPVDPVGPCMVSSEGTCQAWFRYHRQGPKPKVGQS